MSLVPDPRVCKRESYRSLYDHEIVSILQQSLCSFMQCQNVSREVFLNELCSILWFSRPVVLYSQSVSMLCGCSCLCVKSANQWASTGTRGQSAEDSRPRVFTQSSVAYDGAFSSCNRHMTKMKRKWAVRRWQDWLLNRPLGRWDRASVFKDKTPKAMVAGSQENVPEWLPGLGEHQWLFLEIIWLKLSAST